LEKALTNTKKENDKTHVNNYTIFHALFEAMKEKDSKNKKHVSGDK
jgi:hypothetical protein